MQGWGALIIGSNCTQIQTACVCCAAVNSADASRSVLAACLLLAAHSDPHLQFVEEVALPPPEVAIDLAEQERNERELAEAVNAPLPADDDDELID